MKFFLVYLTPFGWSKAEVKLASILSYVFDMEYTKAAELCHCVFE